MRRANIIILIVALAMGGLAAFMARSWILAHANTEPAAPMSSIVVANTALAFGTVLSPENVIEIPWASSSVPEGAFPTRAALFKEGRRVVLTPMERSELILKQKITGAGQRASLSALLEEGKRAVTVRVDDVRGVAGFVLPGDRVDVVLIRTNSEMSGRFSDILLQNVKVLAVDQVANERQEKATVVKAVTLEVETDQAQKILLATDIGKLSLILRQAGEGHASQTARVTESDLFFEAPKKVEPAVVPAAIVEKPSGSLTSKVEVIRSMKVQEYSVVRGR
jgi:pilus assembly protein CpaB